MKVFPEARLLASPAESAARGLRSAPLTLAVACLVLVLLAVSGLVGCSSSQLDAAEAASAEKQKSASGAIEPASAAQARSQSDDSQDTMAAAASLADAGTSSPSDEATDDGEAAEAPDVDRLFEELDVTEDYRASFVHGEKPAEYQRYIVLHDTEGGDDAQSVINWWDSNGNLVAAHFIVNKDGSIWQCVPLDKIAHHAGFGDTGHNVEYGTNNEARDDKRGTQPIGEWAADYGMNSYSVGIEMVHQGGEGDYPRAQLEAVDALIAYIDAYYGFESQIIDHKAWRSGNSDTSEEFAPYLKSYQQKRTHK